MRYSKQNTVGCLKLKILVRPKFFVPPKYIGLTTLLMYLQLFTYITFFDTRSSTYLDSLGKFDFRT